jgi:hypothetical protein
LQAKIGECGVVQLQHSALIDRCSSKLKITAEQLPQPSCLFRLLVQVYDKKWHLRT